MDAGCASGLPADRNEIYFVRHAIQQDVLFVNDFDDVLAFANCGHIFHVVLAIAAIFPTG